MAMELRASILTHQDPDVSLLFMQAISQAGPRGNSEFYREAHDAMQSPQRCRDILTQVSKNLDAISIN